MESQSNPNDASVIFIGGASAAGKSTAANMLSKKIGRPVIALDRIHNLLTGYGDTNETNIAATQAVARAFIEELLKTKTKCIVEGGWIRPSTSAELLDQYGNAYFPIYCGYQDVRAEDLLRDITDHGVHWLTNRPEPEAVAFIQKQIETSRTIIRVEAAKYGLNFVDFSDQNKGCDDLQQLFI